MKKILVLGRGTVFGCGAGHQVIALLEHRRDLESRGITLDVRKTMEVERLVEEAIAFEGDAILAFFDFRENRDKVARALETIRAKQKAKLVFVDWVDQTCSPHWNVLPYVDHYLKPYLLDPIERYAEPFEGGYIFTDFLSRKMGVDLFGWNFHAPFDLREAGKVELGWNLCSLEVYRKIMRTAEKVPLPYRFRPIDLNVRFTIGQYEKHAAWYTIHRKIAYEQASSVKGARLSGTGRLRKRYYFMELCASKIVVSPFGWGELCFRDFEAVACGALLVKPSMEHMRTEPNIYQPFRTYVPVKWDFSDLAETCRYYLEHPKEAKAIVENAREAYHAFYRERRVAAIVERLLAVRPEAAPSLRTIPASLSTSLSSHPPASI